MKHFVQTDGTCKIPRATELNWLKLNVVVIVQKSCLVLICSQSFHEKRVSEPLLTLTLLVVIIKAENKPQLPKKSHVVLLRLALVIDVTICENTFKPLFFFLFVLTNKLWFLSKISVSYLHQSLFCKTSHYNLFKMWKWCVAPEKFPEVYNLYICIFFPQICCFLCGFSAEKFCPIFKSHWQHQTQHMGVAIMFLLQRSS